MSTTIESPRLPVESFESGLSDVDSPDLRLVVLWNILGETPSTLCLSFRCEGDSHSWSPFFVYILHTSKCPMYSDSSIS